MSFCATTYANCPNLQNTLDEAFTKRNISTITEPIMFTEFILSNANTDGILQEQINPGRGKRRTVELIYSPRIPKDQITNDCTKVCTSTNTLGDRTEVYEIGDDCVEFNWEIPLNLLRDRCQDDGAWLGDKVIQVMNGLLRRLEEKNIQQAATLFGGFAVGEGDVVADVKTVQTKNAAGDPDIDFISEIAFASMNAGFKGTPFVFGWNEIFKAFRKLQATCCADSGLDLAEMARREGIAFLPSVEVNVTLPDDNFFVLDAGALQLLTYNEFMGPEGIRVVDDGAYVQGVLVHPTLGIPFDWIFSNNCGVISAQLKLSTKLVGMPDDMFCVGDRLDGVTYVQEYAIVNP